MNDETTKKRKRALAKARKVRAKKAEQRKQEKEERVERIAGPAPKEKPRGPWTYKDVSYGNLQTMGVAIAASQGVRTCVDAIASAAMCLTPARVKSKGSLCETSHESTAKSGEVGDGADTTDGRVREVREGARAEQSS